MNNKNCIQEFKDQSELIKTKQSMLTIKFDLLIIFIIKFIKEK